MIEFAIYAACMAGFGYCVYRKAYSKGSWDTLVYLEDCGLITLEEEDES